VVEVGAAPAVPDATAGGGLRATQFQARGVLDQRVLDALDSPADRPLGWATPLAHGLSLAGELLRRSMQQGAPAVTEAILVVVTDGRGNVPLAYSKSGTTVPQDVGRRGFNDALEQARKIQALGQGRRRARSVVIDPGWQANGRLAAELAVELQAPLRHGTPTLPTAAAGSADDWPDLASGGRDA
jgi:magnesium chelatase subunit D